MDILKHARLFRKKGLDGDHLVLAAALVHLSTRKEGYLMPVQCAELSNKTLIPRETTRRKMNELEDEGIAERNGSGFTPIDPNMWKEF